jgi:hypothetical protein
VRSVVPADVKYPTDAGLLAEGISSLVVLSGWLKAMGRLGAPQLQTIS